jgi:HSP20 family molecular chaperone IbpA
LIESSAKKIKIGGWNIMENKNTEVENEKNSRGAWEMGLFRPFASLFSNEDMEPFFGTEERMKTDIKEDEKGYTFQVDAPGVKKEDVKVSFKNGYLSVSYTLSSVKDEKEKNKFIHVERSTGSFARSFYLGDGVEKKDIHAKLADGILTVTLPKKAEKDDSAVVSVD